MFKTYVRGVVCIFILAIATPGMAAKWDNPKKNDEFDLVLKLPLKNAEPWSFVLRRLSVPGEAFWLDEQRFLELGEGGKGGVFERPVSIEINGVTKGDSNWHIWLGKYETTVGQYAAVVGGGDLAAGLSMYAQHTGRGKDYLTSIMADEKKRLLAMAKPADRLAPAYIQLFIRQLNQICMAELGCRESLPQVGQVSTMETEKFLPFFRLPTEIEWEYAARGVAVRRSQYRDSLPVSTGKLGNYAQLKKISSIARRRPIFGFYDLFGNVSEIVGGRMTAEIGGQGAGAWLAKGGNAAGSVSRKLYSSLREEILEFQWRQGDKIPQPVEFRRAGFRLALGSSFQAFDKLANNERPVPKPLVGSTIGKPAAASVSSGLSPTDAIEEVAIELSRVSDPVSLELERRLQNALERLRVENAKQNTRMAKFVTDNTFVKVVRIWSIDKNSRSIVDLLKNIPPDSEKKRRKRSQWSQQLEDNTVQIKRLMQEYEEGLSAIASIPDISSDITETVDLNGYRQSHDQTVMAHDAIKMLSDHIGRKKRREVLDVRKEIDINYPF